MKLRASRLIGEFRCGSEIQTPLQADARKFGPAELCTRSQSYRASEKTGLSENRRARGALREVQRSAPKQRHKGPNGRTSHPGEPMCLVSVAEGEELGSNILHPQNT
jgi:hypothetical protein